MSELFKLPSCFQNWGAGGSSLQGEVLVGQDVGWTIVCRLCFQQGPWCSLTLPSWMSAHVLMVFEVWGRSNKREVFSCMIAFLFHYLDKALSPSLITYKMCYEMWPCFTGIAPKVTLQSRVTYKNRSTTIQVNSWCTPQPIFPQQVTNKHAPSLG